MKLITAQEIKNMTKTELQNFFHSLSRAQSQREFEEARISRLVGNMSLKLALYLEYSFD